MSSFNYNASAELFVNNGGRGLRSMTCMRYDRAADAVRHVSEILPASNAGSAVIEVEEVRYRYPDILNLYKAREYPLPRQ